MLCLHFNVGGGNCYIKLLIVSDFLPHLQFNGQYDKAYLILVSIKNVPVCALVR